MIFYTRSCSHLADHIKLSKGRVIIEHFEDGELSIKILDDIDQKHVWVCSSTIAPAENILETFFLINALQQLGAYIKVLFIYFGYARQDKMFPGEPLSVEVICRCLQQFICEEIHVVHIHNPGVCAFLSLHNHIPFNFFNQCVDEIDLIVAPDEGATLLAKLVATYNNKPYTVIKKMRQKKEQVRIMEVQGNVKGKCVLIVDDMISTGKTIVRASEALYKKGAKKIYVAATHGLFSSDAFTIIEQSVIEKVFVTNTVIQTHTSSKVTSVDISSFLQNIFT